MIVVVQLAEVQRRDVAVQPVEVLGRVVYAVLVIHQTRIPVLMKRINRKRVSIFD